jgi:hypothetical protein
MCLTKSARSPVPHHSALARQAVPGLSGAIRTCRSGFVLGALSSSFGRGVLYAVGLRGRGGRDGDQTVIELMAA